MATAAKTTPQDLPPKGGYAAFPTDRVRLRTILSGPATIVGYFGITAASLYLYFLNYRKIKQEEVEMRSSRLALFPMLIAERDRDLQDALMPPDSLRVDGIRAKFVVSNELQVEEFMEFLKQLNRNRCEEAELMKNVPDWKVGTWHGEPIYRTIPDDKLIEPSFIEYYVHSSYKEMAKRMNILLWS